MDYGRKLDLLDLAKAKENAKTVTDKERLDKLAYRIAHESAPIQSLRDELIRSFRAKDYNKMKRVQEHIHNVRLNETYGKSWGSNRGEK